MVGVGEVVGNEKDRLFADQMTNFIDNSGSALNGSDRVDKIVEKAFGDRTKENEKSWIKIGRDIFKVEMGKKAQSIRAFKFFKSFRSLFNIVNGSL